MSTHFDLWCDTCQVFGPEIRRSGGTTLVVRTETGFESGADAWTKFLIEHEFCFLILRREVTRSA